MMRRAFVAMAQMWLLAAVARAVPIDFMAPVNVAELNTEWVERDPALTADGLEVFFQSDRPGGAGLGDIWRATRPNASSSFGAPVNVAELNTPGGEGGPHLSPDGLVLYFHRNWGDHTDGADIFVATRPDRWSSFSPPQPIAEVRTPRNEGGPHITADALGLYFNYDIAHFNEDLYVARRANPGDAFNPKVRIDELSTLSYERDPWVSADELGMFFSSDRPTHGHVFRIFVSTRAATDEPWGAPMLLDGLDQGNGEGQPFLDEAHGALYYHSHRPGGAGSLDIWMAQATPDIIPEPATLALVVAGIAGIAASRKRQREGV